MLTIKGVDSEWLEGERLILRPVDLADVTEDYVSWMNDPKVNRYMETRFRSQLPEDIQAFVRDARADSDIHFFAIVLKKHQRHIGNIKLALRPEHSRGEISLLIGDKTQWGLGLASEAISLVVEYGFRSLGLIKITAGCYASNIGSARAFEKCGFKREALLRGEYECEGERVDGIRFARFVNDQGLEG